MQQPQSDEDREDSELLAIAQGVAQLGEGVIVLRNEGELEQLLYALRTRPN